MIRLFLVLIFLAGSSLQAHAGRAMVTAVAAQENECPLRDEAQVNVTFNTLKANLDNIKGALDNKITEVEALSQQMGFGALSVQNMNFNVYSNNDDSCCDGDDNAGSFNANGSVSFKMDSADKAAAFTAALMKKGYNVNLNVNSYRRCD